MKKDREDDNDSNSKFAERNLVLNKKLKSQIKFHPHFVKLFEYPALCRARKVPTSAILF